MRSLSEVLGWERPARPALVGVPTAASGSQKVLLRGERSARVSTRRRVGLDHRPSLRVEIAFGVAVLLGASTFGAIRGGQLDAFVAHHGGLDDFVARTLGFGVNSVTVSGATHMSESRILAIAGIDASRSLPFFDVAQALGIDPFDFLQSLHKSLATPPIEPSDRRTGVN